MHMSACMHALLSLGGPCFPDLIYSSTATTYPAHRASYLALLLYLAHTQIIYTRLPCTQYMLKINVLLPFPRVEAIFQADGAENENFCSGADGCSVAAYYIEVEAEDPEADIIFGTACQARDGVTVYEGYTGTGSTFEEVSMRAVPYVP